MACWRNNRYVCTWYRTGNYPYQYIHVLYNRVSEVNVHTSYMIHTSIHPVSIASCMHTVAGPIDDAFDSLVL